MTPEQLDKAKWDEAYDRAMKADREGDPLRWEQAAVPIYRQLTIDNWTPPDPISPRVLAAREWLKGRFPAIEGIGYGLWDNAGDMKAFLAGFAAAVKLADELVIAAGLVATGDYKPNALFSRIATYRQSIGDE